MVALVEFCEEFLSLHFIFYGGEGYLDNLLENLFCPWSKEIVVKEELELVWWTKLKAVLVFKAN